MFFPHVQSDRVPNRWRDSCTLHARNILYFNVFHPIPHKNVNPNVYQKCEVNHFRKQHRCEIIHQHLHTAETNTNFSFWLIPNNGTPSRLVITEVVISGKYYVRKVIHQCQKARPMTFPSEIPPKQKWSIISYQYSTVKKKSPVNTTRSLFSCFSIAFFL